ncbi:MAG: alcohol dehydrogenase catalytic domain-containing protein [Acidimicrobiales bacterium]
MVPTSSGFYRERLRGRQPPFVPGMDAAGVISEVGVGTAWNLGDVVTMVARRTPRRCLRRPCCRPRRVSRPRAGGDRHSDRLIPQGQPIGY